MKLFEFDVPKRTKPLQQDLVAYPNMTFDRGQATIFPKGTEVEIARGGDDYRNNIMKFVATVDGEQNTWFTWNDVYYKAVAKPRKKKRVSEATDDELINRYTYRMSIASRDGDEEMYKRAVTKLNALTDKMNAAGNPPKAKQTGFYKGDDDETRAAERKAQDKEFGVWDEGIEEADAKMPATRDRAIGDRNSDKYGDDTKAWPKSKRTGQRAGRYLKGKHGLGQKNPNAADYYDDQIEEDMSAQVSSVPRTKDNKLNPKGRIKVKPPRGKAYYFKTVDDAEIFFGKDMAEIEANATVTYPKVKEVTESDNNDEQVLQAIKAQFKLDWPSSIRRWIKTARAYGIPLTVEEYAAYRKDSGQVEEAIVPYDGDDQDEYPFWDDETGEVFPAGMNSEVSFDNDEEDDDDDDDDDDWDTPEPKRRSFDSAQQALAYSTFGDIAAGGGDPIDYLMTNMGLDMGLIDSMAIDQGYEDANEWAQSYQEMESVLNNAGLKKHK